MAEQISLNIDNYTVHSYNVDFVRQLSIVSLFNFLQESAWRHASNNAFGFNDLIEQGCFWALTRVKLIIKRYPVWGDDLRIETWSKEPDALIAYRDFEVFDGMDEAFIKATSAWLVVDIKSRRPQRMATFKDRFPHLYTRYAIKEHPAKLPVLSGENIFSRNDAIYMSDIDMNGHVNNANYIRWVIDTFPFSYIEAHELAEVEVDFMHESKAGEHYIVNINKVNNLDYLCNIVRVEDRYELARVGLKFRVK